MRQEVNNRDFERAVELLVAPALAGLGFAPDGSKSDRLWDCYFFRRGFERFCVYYLEKDLEFNFMISMRDGADFANPSSAPPEWIYGIEALAQARGRSLSQAELADMETYLDRGSDEIARLFTNQLVEIFSS